MSDQKINHIIQKLYDCKDIESIDAKRIALLDVISCLAKECMEMQPINDDNVNDQPNINQVITKKNDKSKSKSPEEQMIDQCIEIAANKVREVKRLKAPLEDVKAAINELIELKNKQKDMKKNIKIDVVKLTEELTIESTC